MVSHAFPEIAVNWTAVSAVIQTLAVAALAWFGAVQLWRERQQKQVRREAAETQISTTAYLLRRQLLSWLVVNRLSAWLLDKSNRDNLNRGFNEAEARLMELVRLSGDASSDVADRLHKAFMLFGEATGRLNVYMAAAQTGSHDTERTHGQLVLDAVRDLWECLGKLEAGPIREEWFEFERQLELRPPMVEDESDVPVLPQPKRGS